MTSVAINELKKYTLGRKNTEKVEISVLQLNRVIKALEQEPKTGHWISLYDVERKVCWCECDHCHSGMVFNSDYCPYCGCRMIEPQERNGEE